MSDFYATQSPMTDPKANRAMLDDLPSDLPAVARTVQGLVYHYMAGEFMFGYAPPKARMGEIDTRSLAAILARLHAMDDRPLQEPRDYANRIVGCCRDYSLLACAILRHQGIPARLRYGFGSYFEEGYWFDHVVVESWTGARWQRFDPQLLGIFPDTVNLLDMTEDAFVTGGRAWQMCRTEGADPARFGLGTAVPEISGWWFIRGRLQLDVAALQKQEMLCWDEWNFARQDIELTQDDEELLDHVAWLTQQDDHATLTNLWQTDARLHLPAEVTCHSPAIGPHLVKV